MSGPNYRWAVLAAGTAAQASFSTLTIGLPALAPAIRGEYDLSLSGVGVVLAAEWVGLSLALLPWGLAADRLGERRVLGVGLAGCGGCLAGAAFAPTVVWLALFLALAGAVGASVQSASGRAVMAWFGPEERGLAFGVRQTAVPVGGLIGALALPAMEAAGGLRASFLLLAGLCVTTAVIGTAVLRERPSEDGVETAAVERTLADGRLWLLCSASGFYVAAQIALISFLVLFLHDARGFGVGAAALALAAAQAIAVVLRIAAGRWSDVLGSRVVPLRRIGIAMLVTLLASATATGAPDLVVVPTFIAASALSMAWNGLSFVAAAEIAGHGRSGAAIGFQQTVLSVVGIAVPPGFAALVELSSWRTAYALFALLPLAGWLLLRRVQES